MSVTSCQDSKALQCVACGSRYVRPRGQAELRFRSLPIGRYPTAVVLPIPRAACRACWVVRQVEVAFAEPRRTYTKAVRRYALGLPRCMTILDVACHLGVSWDVIKDIQKALALARQAGDLPRIAETRSAGDLLAEKLLLERRGQVEANLKDPTRAQASYEQALRLARRVGDHHQEGFLLWRIGAIHAGRGDRDAAIARSSEAIGLFRKRGRPHAAWFAQHLDRYRNDLTVGLAVPTSAPGGRGMDASISMATPSESGPGILRMAVSASKAMTKFIGSGMKAASPEIRDWRLATCKVCEHHTGIRCRVCGCFTDVKARLGGEACPIGKW